MATARVVKDISFTTNLVITTRPSEGTVIQSNIITCSLSSRCAPMLMVNSDRLKCQVKWKYTNIYYTGLGTLPLGTSQSLWQLLRKRGASEMECATQSWLEKPASRVSVQVLESGGCRRESGKGPPPFMES